MNVTKSFLLHGLCAAAFAVPGLLCASTADWNMSSPKDATSIGITIDGEHGSMGRVPIKPISKECTSTAFYLEQNGKEELRAFRWNGWVSKLSRDEWTVITLKFQVRCRKPSKIIFELRPQYSHQRTPDKVPFEKDDICFFDVACVTSPDVKIKNGDFAKAKFDVWNVKSKDWTEQEPEFKAKQMKEKDPKIQKMPENATASEEAAPADKTGKAAKNAKGAKNNKGGKGAPTSFFFMRTCRTITQEIDVKPEQTITLTFMVRGGDLFPAYR